MAALIQPLLLYALAMSNSPVLAIPAPAVAATTITTMIGPNTLIIEPTDVILNGFDLSAMATGLSIQNINIPILASAAADIALQQPTAAINFPNIITELPPTYSSILNNGIGAHVGGIIASILGDPPPPPTTSTTTTTAPPPPPSTTASCNTPITSLNTEQTPTLAPAPSGTAIPSAIAQFCTPAHPIVLTQGETYFLPSPYKFASLPKYQGAWLTFSMTWSADPACSNLQNGAGITASVPTGPDYFCQKYLGEAVAACPGTGEGATWEFDCVVWGYEAYIGPVDTHG